MKRILILAMICAIILVGCKINHDNQIKTEWKENREIITVIVQPGDTLDAFAYEYKPSWMDHRDYREEIKELNDLPNCTIQIGDRLDLYAVK